LNQFISNPGCAITNCEFGRIRPNSEVGNSFVWIDSFDEIRFMFMEYRGLGWHIFQLYFSDLKKETIKNIFLFFIKIDLPG